MKIAANVMLALLSATALSGCIAAAAIPLGAAGLIGREQINKADGRPDASVAPPEQRIDAIPKLDRGSAKAGVESLPNMRVVDVAPTAEPTSANAVIPFARRSLAAKGSYGDSYDGLTRYLFAKSQARERGAAVQSVVLFPHTQVEHPDFTVCADMPLAMVVDLGNADAATVAQSDPGLVEAVTTARMADVGVQFTSDRSPTDATMIAAAIDAAGLGPVKHGIDLWMAGDLASTGKDSLRWKIASSHCIIALVGHRPGDFTQIYDNPETADGSPALDSMRGNGWFLFPAPGADVAL